MVRIGVVGSRRHPNKQQVLDYITSLPKDAHIVTGGAKGVDTWAMQAAFDNGLGLTVIYPKITEGMAYGDMVKEYYARNKKIVEDSEKIVAFVMPDRKGGTENTIKWAKKLGKEITIIYPEET